MHHTAHCVIWVALMVPVINAKADSLAEQLLASYDGVQSVTCEIRKDAEAEAERSGR